MTIWKHRPTAYYLLLSLCLVPAVLIALLISKYGVDMIDWDQWEVASFFIKYSQGRLTAADLFSQQAEYRQFFPNLIFVVLGYLTQWNIKVEMFASFFVICLIALTLYRLASLSFSEKRWTNALLMLLTILILFAPAQFESLLLGEQIIYFIPAACITTCLCVGYSQLSSNTKLIICFLLSIFSTFSSANGIICWLVIPPVLFHSGWKNWRVAVWLLGLLSSATVYFYSFQKPSYTPDAWAVLHNPLQGLFFFCALLGAPLMASNKLILISTALGAVLLALFLLSFFYVWKFSDDQQFKSRAIGWLMLGSYSFLTAIMVTVGRLGAGKYQALASRYISFSLYLLIALVYLIPLITDQALKRGKRPTLKVLKPLLASAVILLIVIHLFNSAAAIRQTAWMKIRRLEQKACLLFINVAPNQCINDGFREFATVSSRVNAINELGFLRPKLIRSNNIKEIADTNSMLDSSSGRFENLGETSDRFIASGWAGLPGNIEPADAVLLTYQKDNADPIIFAYVQMKIAQPSFQRLLVPHPDVDWRWQTSISIDGVGVALPISVSAWAFDATTGKAYKLGGTYVIEGNGKTPQLVAVGAR